MKGKKIKTIATLLIIAIVITLLKKYPDVTILSIGVGAIIIIGMWLIEVDKEE